MNSREIADKLVKAPSSKKQKQILAEEEVSPVELAWHLKEICYESWANAPTIAQKTAGILNILSQKDTPDELNAISSWVNGISEITKGEFEAAINRLDHASELFKKIGKTLDAANIQVAKLIPLALLGNYDKAIENGERVLKTFEKNDDELAAGKVEMNLSNIVSRRGQHLKAKKYCESALRRFLSTKEKKWRTMAENGLANTYSELNNFRKAEEFYAKALRSAKDAEMFVTEAEIEASLGNLATFRGNYSEALNYLEMSRRKFHKLKMPHQTAIANLEIAEIYQTLNLTEESHKIYDDVSQSFRKLKLQGEEARTRKNLGKLLIKKREFEKAREELQKSAKLYLAEKNLSGAASVKLSEANLEMMFGGYHKALKIIHKAKKLLKKNENLRLNLQANFLHGDILRNLKKYKVAERFLKETYAEASKNEQKSLAPNCLNSLGKLALQKDEIEKAEKHFKKSIDITENLRSPLPAEEFRMAFLADNLKPFENLAKIYLEKKEIEKAFVFTEKAKSRSLADAISGVEKKASRNDRQDSKLKSKLKTLREELNWFYSRLSRVKESEIENLQSEVKRCELKIAEIMRQINSTEKLEFRSTKTEISVKDIQNTLDTDQALIEFVKFDENLSAFVITSRKIKFFENLANESEIVLLLEALQFQFGTLRYGEGFAEEFADDLKRKTDFYLQKLHGKLLAPLSDIIENLNLIIIPVSTLFYVPFQGLFDGEKYVIDRKEVVTSPSATVWHTLTKKVNNKTLESVLLIGFADENIPLVNKELTALKQIFPTAQTFLGKDATFANYTENAENRDVIHLACHGQFRPDNPMFSSLHLADGFVTVRDICSRQLNAELVTLSACETGLNKIHAGDEILGLARGFLTAGVRSIVLSLWTVNDKATKDLMKDFYSELQHGSTISASLQKAQKKFIKTGKHPYFWASFGIIGK